MKSELNHTPTRLEKEKMSPQLFATRFFSYCLGPVISYVGGNTGPVVTTPGSDPFVLTVNRDDLRKEEMRLFLRIRRSSALQSCVLGF